MERAQIGLAKQGNAEVFHRKDQSSREYLMIRPKQGEIWLFDPDPTKGREIGKKVRPALIISSDSFNKGSSGLVIIIPMTSKDKKIFSHIRFDPPEGGVKVTSFAACEHIRSITKERLIKKMGTVKNIMKLIEVQSWIKDLIWIE